MDELSPPERRREFSRSSFFSNIRRCQLIRWQYCDSKGRVFSGIAQYENEARRAAEKLSGEKIETKKANAPEGPA